MHEESAYCEPPPKEPCPPGSDWTSQSADDGYCAAERTCDTNDCGPDATCVPAGFCLTSTCYRCSMSRVVGLCHRDADCPQGVPYNHPETGGNRCWRAYFCDPQAKRVAADYKRARLAPPSPIVLSVPPKAELAECGSESCPSGQLCLPLSLCVGEGSAGGKPAAVLGGCMRGARCPDGSVCTRRFRCVDPRAWRPTREGKPVTAEPLPAGKLPTPRAGAR